MDSEELRRQVAEANARYEAAQQKVEVLQWTLDSLRAEVALKRKLHSSILGTFGEKLVAEFPGVWRVLKNKDHDIASLAGWKYEVKMASLKTSEKSNPGKWGSWQWNHLLSRDGSADRHPTKDCDALILIGEANPNCVYKGTGQQFIFFVVPPWVIRWIQKHQDRPQISLCANREGQQKDTAPSRRLYDFEEPLAELEAKLLDPNRFREHRFWQDQNWELLERKRRRGRGAIGKRTLAARQQSDRAG